MNERLSPHNKFRYLPGMISVVLIAVVVPEILGKITSLGHNIPQEDIPTDYLVAVLWAFVLGVSILSWPISVAHRLCLLWGWCAKIMVTLGLMLWYENHYGLDAYGYFEESTSEPFSLAGFTLAGADAGTLNIINLTRLHNIFLPPSYHAMKVSCAMLGLVGVYLYYRSAVVFMQREDCRIFYLFALFPGILFWSSILGKDPIVFLGIALYTYGAVTWQRYGRWWCFPAMAGGIFIAMLIRMWLGPIMVLPLLVLFMRGMRSTSARVVLVLLAGVALFYSAGPMLDRFKIQALDDLLVAADRTTQGFLTTAGGSTQVLEADLTSAQGIASFVPIAAFTALFRPLPGEVMNPFGLLAGLESAILLVLLVLAIKRTRMRELAEPLVMWAICFVTVWALVNGIVSSTNFGLAVRYKLQVLPVLLGFLLYLARARGVAERKGSEEP